MKLGRYELLSEIGRGGMGVVHRARSDDGRDVAIKTLLETDPDAIAGFERERRLLFCFSESDGFVPILDQGQQGERRYLVMPFLPGGTLRSRLKSGPLPLDDAVAIVRKLARALGKAHERGIMHRDLKPENVLFTVKGEPLVMDLGLAKHFRRDVLGGSRSGSLSATGMIAGTPGYMAPEQIQDARRAGPAADVFALGVILHECLTGGRPFPGKGMLEYVAAVRNAPRPLSATTPAWLNTVVARALANDPRARFPDAGALERALAGKPAPRSKAPLAIAAGLVMLAGALVGVGALVHAWRPAPTRPAPAPPPPSPSPRHEPPPDPSPAADPPPPTDELTRSALREIRSGRFDSAMDYATRALKIDPRNAVALEVRGEVRASQSDFQGAIEDYTRALDLQPQFELALVNRSRAWEGLGDTDHALDDADCALQLAPGSCDNWVGRSWALLRKNNVDGALADAQRAIELGPDVPAAWEARGLARIQKEDWNRAVQDLTRALEMHPGLPRSWFGRGHGRLALGDLDGAIADETQAIELDPSNPGAFYLRGLAEDRKQDVDAAARDFRAYLDRSRPDDPSADGARQWLELHHR